MLNMNVKVWPREFSFDEEVPDSIETWPVLRVHVHKRCWVASVDQRTAYVVHEHVTPVHSYLTFDFPAVERAEKIIFSTLNSKPWQEKSVFKYNSNEIIKQSAHFFGKQKSL